MDPRDRHIAEEERRRRANASGDGAEMHDRKADRPTETDRLRRRSRLERIQKTIAYSIVGLLALTIALLLVLLLVLQTGWGREQARTFVIARLNTLVDGAEFRADRFSGTFIGRLTVENLSLVKEDGERIAHIDTFSAQYGLIHLLRNRLRITNIDLINPTIRLTQEPDGTWDLFNVIAPDDTAMVDTVAAETRLVIHLDHLFLANGNVDAVFYTQEGDSILSVRDVYLDMGNAEFGKQFFFEVDSLVGRFSPPAQDYWANLRVGGAVTREQLALSGLRLTSPRSNVEGRGYLSQPRDDPDYVREVEFELTAAPLAFDDLRPFVPGLRAGASALIDVDVGSAEGVLLVESSVRFSDGAHVAVRGEVSPDEPDIRYTARGEVRRFDLSLLTGVAAHASAISADLVVDLSGVSTDRLNGSADASLIDTRFGTYLLDPTLLQSTWDEGRARINLRGGVRGTRFSMVGTTRPMDETPSYNLSGRVENLDVGSLLDGSDLRSDISATFRVDGVGISLPEAEFTADLQVLPSTFNNARIDHADFSVSMVERQMQLATRVRFPAGQFHLQGEAIYGEVLQYALRRGRIENVDLAALLGQNVPSSINGNFSLSGEDTEPESLSLQGSLELFASRYGDVEIAAADLNVALRDGSLEASTTADMVDSGSFQVRVHGRPFADVPSLQVTRGEFRSINLGPLTSSPGTYTDLSGSVVAQIRGFDAESMAISGRLDLDRSRVQQQTINDAYVIAETRAGLLSFNANLDLPEGLVSFSGSARPFDTDPSYHVREGRFRNIDLAAFTGNSTLDSSLSGAFSVEGRGFDPAIMVLQARLEVAASRLNQQRIETIRTDLLMQRGLMRFNSTADLAGARTNFAGYADFTADVPVYAIERGDFANVNVGAFTGSPDLQTRLSGTLELEGQGFDPESMQLSGTLTLADSRINEQEIRSARVGADLARSFLEFGLTLTAPEGITDLAGNVDFGEDVLVYQVTEGSFQALNVGALMGDPGFHTSLTGRLELSGRGTEPETMTASAVIDLDQSTFNQSNLIGGQVQTSIDEGLVLLDGVLSFVDGSATMNASGRFFDEPPVYQATGSFRNVDVGRVLGTDTLNSIVSATFELAGTGFEPETMSVRGRLVADTTRYQLIRVSDLEVGFEYHEGLLELDTLVLHANFADVTAAGRLALYGAQETHASDLRFVAIVHDADPVRQYVPAEAFALDDGQFEGRIFGRPGRVRVNLDAVVASLVYNDVRASRVVGRFSGELTPEGDLGTGEMDASFEYLSVPFLTLRSSDLTLAYRDDQIDFAGDFLIDERRHAHLAAHVDLRAETRRVVIQAVDLVLDRDRWELLQPATITMDGAYRIRHLLLYSDDQQIAIDGVVDPEGMQNLVMTIEELRTGAMADLLGFEGLSGTLNGELDLTGPASAPQLRGSLNMTDIASEGRNVGDLRLSLRYDSLRMNLDALLTHVDGSTLVALGHVPMDLSLAPAEEAAVGEGVQVRTQQAGVGGDVDLSIVADSFAINWIDPFLDRTVMDRVSGRLSADIQVSGTFDEPTVDGFMRLTQGRVYLPETNITLDDIQLSGRLVDNRMLFEDARVRSNGGSLTASGQLMLADLTLGEFDIDAVLSDFRAIQSPEYHAVVSGEVQLSGTTRAPVLTGGIRLISTDIFLDETAAAAEIEVVALTDRDIRILEERFGRRITEADTARAEFYENMTMDINVRMERNTWIRQRRNPRMAIQFEGTLDVQKQPQQEPFIFGAIEVIPQRSFIDQFGRRFDIASGTITFNGPADEFIMDVQAEYQVRSRRNPGEAEATILLGLQGRLDDLRFTLESEPPMEETHILSYIATGQPAGQTLQLSDAGTIITQQGAGAVAAVIEGIAGENLGLDVIEIQHDGLRGAVLIAGKYVSRRAYVGVNQPVSFTSSTATAQPIDVGGRQATEVTLEYEIFRWLLMRVAGGASALRGNLFWEFAY